MVTLDNQFVGTHFHRGIPISTVNMGTRDTQFWGYPFHVTPGLRSAVVDNIRRRIVGVMFPPSMFEDQCVDFRTSMIDVSTFVDRCVALRRSMCRPSKIDVTMCRPSETDVSTFEDRCVDLRRWMCWPSKADDRCVDLRRSVIDVSTFEDRCVDLRTQMVDVKLGCYTCSKYWYSSCMRISYAEDLHFSAFIIV